uniref:5-hydroxytryptamine receptor 7 n=1 Tax=Pan paniscus TaxID=9597 RepID=A0A2R9CLI9_PANPA
VMDVNSSGHPDLYGRLCSFLLPEVGGRLPDLSPDGGAEPVAVSGTPHLLSGAPEVTASPAPTWDATPGNASGLVIGSVLTLISLLTIAGNCLVKLRQPSNYLIVSMALANLSVAMVVMPFISVTDLIGGKWIFGHFFCNVFFSMNVMCCTAWILTLYVISIDRYLGIRRPLTYPMRQKGKCMTKMILSVCLLSTFVTLPTIFGRSQNVNDDKVCLVSQDFGYTTYSTAVIYKAARKNSSSHPEWHSEVPGGKNISIFKRKQKAATTLGIIVWASTMYPSVYGTACSCIPLWVERIFPWLGYANSLINPFIYAFFNWDLRTTYCSRLQCQYQNINQTLSAAGMHEALKLAERPERPEFVLQNSDYCRKKSHDS